MRILPACAEPVLVPLAVSCCMTCVVSAISTLRALPLSAFWQTWPLSWLISWMVAYPIMLLMLPLVRRAVSACTKKDL